MWMIKNSGELLLAFGSDWAHSEPVHSWVLPAAGIPWWEWPPARPAPGPNFYLGLREPLSQTHTALGTFFLRFLNLSPVTTPPRSCGEQNLKSTILPPHVWLCKSLIIATSSPCRVQVYPRYSQGSGGCWFCITIMVLL